MKKIKKSLSLLVLSLFTFALFACESNAELSVDTNFYFSTDFGVTYNESSSIYGLGDTIYFMLELEILSNSRKSEEIDILIKIPNLEDLQIHYKDGQIPVSVVEDSVENMLIYSFKVSASSIASSWIFVFQITSNVPNDVLLKIEFDDSISSNYDKQTLIIFN